MDNGLIHFEKQRHGRLLNNKWPPAEQGRQELDAFDRWFTPLGDAGIRSGQTRKHYTNLAPDDEKDGTPVKCQTKTQRLTDWIP